MLGFLTNKMLVRVTTIICILCCLTFINIPTSASQMRIVGNREASEIVGGQGGPAELGWCGYIITNVVIGIFCSAVVATGVIVIQSSWDEGKSPGTLVVANCDDPTVISRDTCYQNNTCALGTFNTVTESYYIDPGMQ